ncbi:hypothetical protein ACN47E_004250 [Coniothyrium glycines]
MPTVREATDSPKLARTADWAIYTAVAALAFSKNTSKSCPKIFTSTDDGCLNVFNTLNWLEVHDEYSWPDFTDLGYDFNKAIQLRRTLVSDVLAALQEAGTASIANEPDTLATPERSVARAKRSLPNCCCMHTQKPKRQRKLVGISGGIDDSGEGSSSDSDYGAETYWEDEEVLANAMRVLLENIYDKPLVDFMQKNKAATKHESLALFVEENILKQ